MLTVAELVDYLRELPSDMPIYRADRYYGDLEGYVPVASIADILGLSPITFYEHVNSGEPFLYFD